jgi:hypothetical protein
LASRQTAALGWVEAIRYIVENASIDAFERASQKIADINAGKPQQYDWEYCQEVLRDEDEKS